MESQKLRIKDGAFTLLVLGIAFVGNVLAQKFFDIRTLIPMTFVLGVFLISLKTQGYFWGVTASLLSVLAVNYAFTFPYYAIDLISPECVTSAVVMLIVAILTGMLTTKIKVQEKHRAESEKERLRANLLRAVSHDLRTPLTSIYGASSTVIENYDLLTRQQRVKLLEEVRGDAQWLIRMVENLLSVTRIDGEGVQILKTPTVLEELVDAVLVKFQKHCPHQAVTVDIPAEFVSIPMDAMLMEQVLTNILENAVDHATGMSELILRVTCHGGKARFEIMDNGCGIAPERIRALFTGYMERQNGPTDGSRSNMGIGLAVCAAIVRAHGGEIWAENRPEGGAAFYFTLALEENDE